jgi:hypothetical protein
MPGFTDRQEVVIRGALEKDGGFSDNPAVVVRKALLDILGENWSIMMYGGWSSVEGAVYPPHLQYQNKCVYGIQTKTADSGEHDRMKKFLDTEFGWAAISDFRKVQPAAEQKINNNFLGSWKVNLIKFGKDGSWDYSCWGFVWEHGDYKFCVLRTS